MMGTLWVQSKYSKEAKKWEVCSEDDKYYNVKDDTWASSVLKSEYIPCDPPEKWEVCTRDRVGISENGIRLSMASGMAVHVSAGYRWGWSEKDPDALVIERKVP